MAHIGGEVEILPQELLTQGWQVNGVNKLEPHDEVSDLLDKTVLVVGRPDLLSILVTVVLNAVIVCIFIYFFHPRQVRIVACESLNFSPLFNLPDPLLNHIEAHCCPQHNDHKQAVD